MKILWITHSPFPEISNELQLKSHAKGWIISSANSLTKEFNDITLGVISFYDGKKLLSIKKNNIIHYLLPNDLMYNPKAKSKGVWQKINLEFNPDVIHIHGSEYFHSSSYINECGSTNVVLSIQGLVSIYERYYYGGISNWKLLRYTTPRDLIRLDTFFSKRKNMQERGFFEKSLIQKIKHIIGRTSWDKAHAWAINPNARYHFCNETLRNSFYENRWSIHNCKKRSIFISQAQYPIKGFHQFLKALSIVIKHYPDTEVNIAGTNYFSNQGIRINGYGNYINSLIKKYNLVSHIKFTGFLSEQKICQKFLYSHISVCPSAIENSPNSIGEAQLLGVPVIASLAGGTADMIKHGETGLLYRFEEVEMLAYYICELFSNNELSITLSGNGRKIASLRHNKNHNTSTLYHIYRNIAQEDKFK